jgi:transcriptional regulator with XRE-family HTH domain
VPRALQAVPHWECADSGILLTTTPKPRSAANAVSPWRFVPPHTGCKLSGTSFLGGSTTSTRRVCLAGTLRRGRKGMAEAKQLREARIERGMTLREVAEKIGGRCNGGMVSNWELGRARPGDEYWRKWHKALGLSVQEEGPEVAEVKGLGRLVPFDPYDREAWPTEPGVYVFYDVSDRPIYIGEGENASRRINEHEQKFWYKRPIVEDAVFLRVDNKDLRKQIEAVLIEFLRSNAIINQQHVKRD